MAGSEDLAATAFAFEAIVQEAFFIAGPLLVALLVAVASPAGRACVRRRGHLGGNAGVRGHARVAVVAAGRGSRAPDGRAGVPGSADAARGERRVRACVRDPRGDDARVRRRARLGRDRRRAAGSARAGQHARRRLVRVARVRRPPLHADDLLLRGVRGRAGPARVCGLDPGDAGPDGVAGFFVAPWAATTAALVGRLAPTGCGDRGLHLGDDRRDRRVRARRSAQRRAGRERGRDARR